MKVIKKIGLICFFVFYGLMASGQPPPPDRGGSGDQSAKGVYIEDGFILMLVLGAAFGAKKIYDYRRRA